MKPAGEGRGNGPERPQNTPQQGFTSTRESKTPEPWRRFWGNLGVLKVPKGYPPSQTFWLVFIFLVLLGVLKSLT